MNILRCIIMLSLLVIPAVQAQTNVTLTFENVDSYPWSMKGGKGIDLILLKMVDDALPDVTFKYIEAPWKRCLNNIETGKTEGCFTASFKEKRLQYGFYPGMQDGGEVDENLRLHASSYSLYVLKGSSTGVGGALSITNLSGKVAAPSGYSIGGDLQSAGYKVDATASKTANNFQKLLLGRVGAVAALTLNGNNILSKQKKYSDKIKVVEMPLVSKPYYLMFSKQFIAQNKVLAEKIWKTIAELRETKEFKDKAGEFLAK